MKAAEDFLLLVLHALLHSEYFAGSSPSPLDVARAIVDTHLLLPTSSQHLSSDASIDGVNYFSDRMRSQLLWSRCINTKGMVGINTPCDLHPEHLNRRLKTVLRSMGANISPDAIVRAAKDLRAVHNVCLRFEEETCSSTRSAHSDIQRVPSFGEDFVSLLTLLIDNNVFEPQQNRYHPSFAFKKGLMQHFTREELLKHITSITSSNVR